VAREETAEASDHGTPPGRHYASRPAPRQATGEATAPGGRPTVSWASAVPSMRRLGPHRHRPKTRRDR
jgi:hypothetical protein